MEKQELVQAEAGAEARMLPALAGEAPSSQQELSCPVCLSHLNDPFVTACGHTFCHACITTHLQTGKNCPCCSHFLSRELIFPNFLLSKLAKRAAQSSTARGSTAGTSTFETIQRVLAEGQAELQAGEVEALLQQLWEAKQAAEAQEQEGSMDLLLHFLRSSREDKARRLQELQQELSCLDSDIGRVQAVEMGGGVSSAVPAMGPRPPPRTQQQAAASPHAHPTMHDMQQAALAAAGQQQHSSEPRPFLAQPPVGPGGGLPPHPFAAAAAAAGLHPQSIAASAAAPLAGLPPTVATLLQAVVHQPQLAAALLGSQPGLPHLPQQLAEYANAALASAVAASAAVQALGGAAPGAAAQQQLLPLSYAPSAGGMAPSGAGAFPAAMPLPSAGGFTGSGLTPGVDAGASMLQAGGGGANASSPRAKRPRPSSQLEDLQQCYLRLRASKLQAPAGGAQQQEGGADAEAPELAAASSASAREGGIVLDGGLQEFSRMLSVLSRCNKLKVVAEIPRASLRQSSSIVSSVEFDRDGTLFATAGVSKRISLFEYASVAATPGLSVHCPVLELVTRSKLSCLSWNKYIQSHIAASDYEGVVSLWDVASSTLVQEYEAHPKRIWSVDYCEADPTLLASGSDDCTVKLWSTKSPGSLAQLDLKANVCAVKWRPGSTHELAVGSADHRVYLLDARMAARPLHTFVGHRKAVSYVRFANAGELVSASTDSTLRMWTLGGAAEQQQQQQQQQQAERVFEGHANEKNFVGLGVEGDFLACGSETNELFVYHKALSKAVARRSFAAPAAEEGHDDDEVEGSEDGAEHTDRSFISAVCWRPGSQQLLAANSSGTIKVFQLSGGSGATSSGS